MSNDFRFSEYDGQGWMKGLWIVFALPVAGMTGFLLFLVVAAVLQVLK